MNLYKEYGGYIEFETLFGVELHTNALALNCGRNCLAYLIETKKIQTIYLPLFLCASVSDICKKYDVKIGHYHIDRSLRPIFDLSLKDNEYLYIVNYYGQLNDEEIVYWKSKYDNLIVDYSQAFFQRPIENIDSIYTCRKFFGVADGAYLYTSSKLQRKLDIDYSFERMHFLMGRFEKGANDFYNEYVENNRIFKDLPILNMSRLTHNILRGIDYQRIENQRTQNFKILDKLLGKYNKLKKIITPIGAFMYPLYISNGAQVRKLLQSKKIYIPTLWPDVFAICDESSLEYDMARNILPIPVDQRYNEEDMNYLAEVLIECFN